MTSYLNNSCDVMNNFAKLEKFLPHSINHSKFYDFRKSNARVGEGGGGGVTSPPYKLGLNGLKVLNFCEM